MTEKVHREHIDQQQEADLKAYLEALNRLLNNKVALEYMQSRALEKAKWLSMNSFFQQAVEEFRERWNIEARLPSESLFEIVKRPDQVLIYYSLGKEHSPEDWERLEEDLQLNICRPSDLDWEQDYGLLVAAVCFDLTRKNLMENWDQIKAIAAVHLSPGVRIILRNAEAESKMLLGSMLTNLFLASVLDSGGIATSAMPEPVRNWIKFAQESILKESHSLESRQIPALLKMARLDPDELIFAKPDIYLKVGSDTVWNDIRRVKDLVRLTQIEIYGKGSSRSREWRQYARDSYVWQRSKLDGISVEDAYNEWLNQDEERLVKPPDVASVQPGLKRIDEYVTREKLRFES